MENVRGGRWVRRLHLRHLERDPLRTPYTQIADQVASLLRDPHLVDEIVEHNFRRIRKPPRLAVDATGVWVAVTDLLRARRLAFTAVTITGGDKVHRAPGGHYRVPKRDLVAALEVPFHAEWLKVAGGLDLWPVLKNELLSFRPKVDLRTAHDSYEHWRESDHDDLVLATALTCWDCTRSSNRRMRVIR